MRATSPAVSVIVLTYNQEDTIATALQSVVDQVATYEFEVVVADDASSDRTPEIVKEFAARYPNRIVDISDGVNRGIPENYFYAFNHCRGKYIADCAGDDYWIGRDSLQRKFDLLEGYPDATMVHTDWLTFDASTPNDLRPIVIDSAMAKARKEGVIMNGRELQETVIARDCTPIIHLSTALYRRSVLEEALRSRRDMVDNPEFGCEDLPVEMALLNRGGLMWLPERTLAYRVNGVGITSEQSKHRLSALYQKFITMTVVLARYYGVRQRDISIKVRNMAKYARALKRKNHFM